MTKRQKLGRGLGSLLGETLDEKGKVIDLELAKIHPNPWQPRRDFDDEALKGLADSIKEKGLISRSRSATKIRTANSSMSWSPAKDVSARQRWQGSLSSRQSLRSMTTR